MIDMVKGQDGQLQVSSSIPLRILQHMNLHRNFYVPMWQKDQWHGYKFLCKCVIEYLWKYFNMNI